MTLDGNHREASLHRGEDHGANGNQEKVQGEFVNLQNGRYTLTNGNSEAHDRETPRLHWLQSGRYMKVDPRGKELHIPRQEN